MVVVGGLEGVVYYTGISLLSLPRKIYARVMETTVHLLVKPQIQEEQCGFHICHGAMHQPYILSRILKITTDYWRLVSGGGCPSECEQFLDLKTKLIAVDR